MTDKTTCPTCLQEGFKNEHGVKMHHIQAHGVSLNSRRCRECGELFVMQSYNKGLFCSAGCSRKFESRKHGENRAVLECEYCGQEYTKKPSHADGSKYCSQDCHNKAIAKPGSENHNWKPSVGIECERCGAVFKTNPSRADTARYCSKECKHGPRVTLACEWCGRDISVKPSHADGSRFCSRRCLGRFRSEHNTGENNPNWKNGHSTKPYSGGFTEKMKQEIRARDGYRCQGCGMDQNTHKRRFGNKLHVHHLDRDKSNHDENNLITMCAVCHPGWEGIPLKPQLVGSD